jgi:hypothetical protein
MKRTISVALASLALSTGSLAAFAMSLPTPDDASSSNLVLTQVQQPGHCGTNMHWNAKEKKCIDARNKTKEQKLDPRNL